MTDPLFMRTDTNQYNANQILYYYNDHLGTPQALRDKGGQLHWLANYSAFGKAEIQTLQQAQYQVTQNLRFPGQYYDQETNLHYNMARYYDPSLGRYITSDPIGLAGGPNTYLYAVANPIINIDPSGLRNIGGPRPPQARNPFQDPLGGLDTLTSDTLDFFCNLNFANEMERINNQIEQKKSETSECQTVYYMVTFLVIGECKRDFNIEFSDEPITHGVICNVDGYGRPRCGFVRGSFKGTKKSN